MCRWGLWLTYQEPGKFPLDQDGEIRRWYANLERLDAWEEVRTAAAIRNLARSRRATSHVVCDCVSTVTDTYTSAGH